MSIKKIYLSPSNQINNVGVYGYNECIQMHNLADKVASYLNKSNSFQVRISQSNWSLKQVVDDSNNWGAALHICMHSDAFELAQGTTVFIFQQGLEAERYAKLLYKNVSALSPGKDRGVKVRNDLYELNSTNAEAVLIENFFHTDLTETRHFLDNIDLYAKAIAASVYEFYSIPFVINTSNEVVKKECSNMAFKDINSVSENAKQSVERLEKLQIFKGTNGNFNPKNNVTREELAIVIDRVLKLLGK
jgi:N-acetylmuramoyl-L-alanine amidase